MLQAHEITRIPLTFRSDIRRSVEMDPTLTNLLFMRDYLQEQIDNLTIAPIGFERNLFTGYVRRTLPTVERLNELLTYNPTTGELFWKVNNNKVKAGNRAGGADGKGYRTVTIDGKQYQEHQICLMIGHQKHLKLFDEAGYDLVVDHIDGNRSNNRLNNLQEITNSENIYKQMRDNIKQEVGTGMPLLTGIEHSGNRYIVNFRIRSWWRLVGQTGGTIIRMSFPTYDEAVIFKLFVTRFPNGDKVMEALNYTVKDEVIINELYNGTIAKSKQTIKFVGIAPTYKHIYEEEAQFYLSK